MACKTPLLGLAHSAIILTTECWQWEQTQPPPHSLLLVSGGMALCPGSSAFSMALILVASPAAQDTLLSEQHAAGCFQSQGQCVLREEQALKKMLLGVPGWLSRSSI